MIAHTLLAPNASTSAPMILNAGCGASGAERLPRMFSAWRHVRIDVDPAVQPDVVADLTDLSAFADNSADAIWTSHCIEHLYRHQVAPALAEIRRVLKPDGFVVVIVPDVQWIARYVVEDRMSEPIYDSPAGPITAHDILFGHGRSIAQGNAHMAHRTGFTPSSIAESIKEAGFPACVIRRRPHFELMAVARKTPWPDAVQMQALVGALSA